MFSFFCIEVKHVTRTSLSDILSVKHKTIFIQTIKELLGVILIWHGPNQYSVDKTVKR